MLEGVRGTSSADMRASRPDPATAAALTLLWGVGAHARRPGPRRVDPELVERVVVGFLDRALR